MMQLPPGVKASKAYLNDAGDAAQNSATAPLIKAYLNDAGDATQNSGTPLSIDDAIATGLKASKAYLNDAGDAAQKNCPPVNR